MWNKEQLLAVVFSYQYNKLSDKNNCLALSVQLKPHPPKSAHMACHALWNLSFPKYVTDGSTPTASLIKKAKSNVTYVSPGSHGETFLGAISGCFKSVRLVIEWLAKGRERYRETHTERAREREREREREQQDILSLWLLAADFCMSCCSHSGQCSCSAHRTEACNWDKLCHDLWIDEASVNTKKSLFPLWGKFSFQLFFFLIF